MTHKWAVAYLIHMDNLINMPVMFGNLCYGLVNRYRLKNEGKFPSVLDTKKAVGGGYYSVRQIVQEIIYNSKQSSADLKYTSSKKSDPKEKEMLCKSEKPVKIQDSYLEKNKAKDHETLEQSMYTKDTFLEESTKEAEISIKFEEVPQTRELGEDTRSTLQDIENSSSMVFQSKQDQKSSVSVEVSDETCYFQHYNVGHILSLQVLVFCMNVMLQTLSLILLQQCNFMSKVFVLW